MDKLPYPTSLPNIRFITPHVSDVIGVIVLASSLCVCVSVSVCPSHCPHRTDVHSDLAWRSSERLSRSSSQVKVIGQRSRSRDQKNYNSGIPLTSENLMACGPAKEETQEYDW